MRYQQNIDKISKDSLHYCIMDGAVTITYATFLELLQFDKHFRTYFIHLLSEIPFRAYQWETPPLNSSTVTSPFEFVVTSSPGIDIPPNPAPFEAFFTSGKDIAVFQNLGGDATLIAPSPDFESSGGTQLKNFSHLGVFMRHAPALLQHSLWQTVGQTTNQRVEKMKIKSNANNRAVWLNTAGGGVAWLHIRLDSRPKYYRHLPYKKGNKGTI